MNMEDALALLLDALGDIRCHSLLVGELCALLAQSGKERPFSKILRTRLLQLGVKGIEAVRLEEFENIGGDIYSMHCAGKGFNIRILYSFLPSRQPVLLLAFYERGGKGKTDYSTYLEPAKARLAEERKRIR